MVDKPLKRCFVICPIGSRESVVRKRSDDIFLHLIKPIAKEHGFDAYRIIDDSRPGEITPNIVKELVEADLVIADLTGENPNVFYELAVRHSSGKPFIQLAAEGTRPPFDVTTLNTIEISQTGFGAVDRTKAELAKHFEAVNAGTASYENPLSRYQQRLHAQQSGDPVERQIEAMKDVIAKLSGEVVELRRSEARRNAVQIRNVALDALLRNKPDIDALALNDRKIDYRPTTDIIGEIIQAEREKTVEEIGRISKPIFGEAERKAFREAINAIERPELGDRERKVIRDALEAVASPLAEDKSRSSDGA